MPCLLRVRTIPLLPGYVIIQLTPLCKFILQNAAAREARLCTALSFVQHVQKSLNKLTFISILMLTLQQQAEIDQLGDRSTEAHPWE